MKGRWHLLATQRFKWRRIAWNWLKNTKLRFTAIEYLFYIDTVVWVSG